MVLFGLTEAHRVCVVEIGTNQRGEVARLAGVAQPDIAVLTLVAIEHSEGIGDIDAIEAEEGALLSALGAAGTAIGNADDRGSSACSGSPAAHKLSYGFAERADYRIVSRKPLDLRQSIVEIARPDATRVSLTTRLLGVPGALAVAAALAVADRVAGAPVSAEVIGAALDLLGGGEAQRLIPSSCRMAAWSSTTATTRTRPAC